MSDTANVASEFEKLDKLRNKGAISADDFDRRKAALLRSARNVKQKRHRPSLTDFVIVWVRAFKSTARSKLISSIVLCVITTLTATITARATELRCDDPQVINQALDVLTCKSYINCSEVGAKTLKEYKALSDEKLKEAIDRVPTPKGYPVGHATDSYIKATREILTERLIKWRDVFSSMNVSNVVPRSFDAVAQKLTCSVDFEFSEEKLTSALQYQAVAETASVASTELTIRMALARGQDPYEMLVPVIRSSFAGWSNCINRTRQFSVQRLPGGDLLVARLDKSADLACAKKYQ